MKVLLIISVLNMLSGDSFTENTEFQSLSTCESNIPYYENMLDIESQKYNIPVMYTIECKNELITSKD